MTNGPKPGESLVVTARSGGTRHPIWSIHPIGGSVLWIRRLAASLPADQALYGIQARGLDGLHEPFESIAAMAEHYVTLVRGTQPHGPYRLCGASFGGAVALEVARRLKASGESVELLAMFDTFGPNYPRRRGIVTRIGELLGQLRRRTWRDRFAFIRARAAVQSSDSLTKGLRDLAGTPMMRAVHNVIAANTRAMEQHRPEPYDGDIVLFRATQRPPEFGGGFEEPTNGWSTVAGGRVEVIPVDADHRFILDPPGVDELAEKFARRVGGPAPSRAVSPRVSG